MKHSRELKIGVFAILVLVASFFVINYLRGKDIFNREMTLTARFDDVEGLVASAPVMIKGFKAGMVSDVVYLPDEDAFEVDCSVRKSFRIPIDSRMTIYSTSIMGGKGILIEPGCSDTLAVSGSLLEGASLPDLVGSVSGEIGPLLSSLGEAVEQLKTAVGSINEVLDDGTKSDIRCAVASLRKSLGNLNTLTDTLSKASPEISSFVASLSGLSVQLDSIAGKADIAMDGVNSVITQLDSADVDGLVGSIRSLSEKIQDPEGTVGKLLNEKGIYESADSLIRQISGLVEKIKENPKKYMKISVF